MSVSAPLVFRQRIFLTAGRLLKSGCVAQKKLCFCRANRYKKEMTLDCRILLVMHLQPRVISVLSYYLTSLVNLSFYRFFDDAVHPFNPFRCIFTSTIFLLPYSRKREPSMPECIARLWLRPLLMFDRSLFRSTVFSLLVIWFLLDRWLLLTFKFILLPATDELSVYLPVHWYHPFWL